MCKYFAYLALCLWCMCLPLQAQLYVAPNGDDTHSGTIDAPLATIHRAVELVEPGQTIWVREGRYIISERIKIPQKETSADRRICLWAMPGEEVIVDGSGMQHTTQQEFKMGRCFYLNHEANYWHFKGLTICHAEDNGMKIEGSYNIVEECVFCDNNDTGLQIGMYKDFSIEETKELPPGTPKFNPGYQYCKGNIVINCDAYNNCDLRTYNGSDDGGDADGFACKLFPGPGTEFHGCRAWNNSDDNWDLYMVYHPVVINECWSYKAGYTPDGEAIGNGNGFKLGGGGSSGGAAFSQSVGAHVITNCVSFDCLHKGFDQNNAYEGMYVLNCTAWGNEYNYRFPTIFEYGGMYVRNCIGFNPTKLNHEFLSADKEGSQLPNTDYNSWTTLDGCNPYKEGQKVGDGKPMTTDYSNEFESLSVADFMAPREADGSLPNNGFAKLKSGSVMIDKGEAIVDFRPIRFMTQEQAEQGSLELVEAASVTIPYNDAAPDFGAFESGVPTQATLRLVSGNTYQLVYRGDAIVPVVYQWGQAATGIEVVGLPATMVAQSDTVRQTLSISGKVTDDVTLIVRTVGGENVLQDTVVIEVSDIAPATLECITHNASQEVVYDSAMVDICFQMGGGATAFEVAGLPQGVVAQVDGNRLTLSGYPTESGTYTVTAIGGMLPVSVSGSISMVIASYVLTGGWYPFQDSLSALPADLKEVLTLIPGGDDSHLSAIDPDKTENGTVPAGCTQGAVVMGRSGGGLQWYFADGIIDLRLNLHFTGGRTFGIEWETAEGETGSVTTEKISKGTYCGWDVLSQSGLGSYEGPITIRLTNKSSSGEVRMYDMYAKIYDKGNHASTLVSPDVMSRLTIYKTSTAIVVQGDDVRSVVVYGMQGEQLRRSLHSSVCSVAGLPTGIYLVVITCAEGRTEVRKVRW